jgi:hypothetical protein
MTIRDDDNANYANAVLIDNSVTPSASVASVPTAQLLPYASLPEEESKPKDDIPVAQGSVLPNPTIQGPTTTLSDERPPVVTSITTYYPGPAIATATGRYHGPAGRYTVRHEDPLAKKMRRRRRRRGRMVAGAAGGALVGAVFLGPIGLAAGVVTGAVVARVASKNGEKRKDQRVARQQAMVEQSGVS